MYLRRAKIRPNVNRLVKTPQGSPVVQASQPSPSTPTAKPPAAAEDGPKGVQLAGTKIPEDISQSSPERVKEEICVPDDKNIIPSLVVPPIMTYDVPPAITAEETAAVAPKTDCTTPKQETQTPRIGVTAPNLDTETSETDSTVPSKEPAIPGAVDTTVPESPATPLQAADTSVRTEIVEASPDPLKTSISDLPPKDPLPETRPSTPQSQICQGSNGYDDSPFVCTSICTENDIPQYSSFAKSPKKAKIDREAARSRRWLHKAREPPERSKMTMVDLIYYNPSENPMTSVPVKKSKEPVRDNFALNKNKRNDLPSEPEPETPSIAPRVKIGEDGQIIIDEESLIIEHTVPEGFNVVVEDSETTYSSFRERLLTRRWSSRETAIFYKALTIVGPDFSLMAQLMPNRTRHELKLKFKREEKNNKELINKLLQVLDVNGLREYQQDPGKFSMLGIPDEGEDDQLPKKGGKRRRTEKKATRRRGGWKKVVEDLEGENGECEDLEFMSIGTPDSSLLEPSGESVSASDAGNIAALDAPGGERDTHDEDSTPASNVTEKPVPKKRGRPRKTPTELVEMSACDSGNSTKKRRGRKKKCDEVQKEQGVDNPAAVDESSAMSDTSNFLCEDMPSAMLEEIVLSETGLSKSGIGDFASLKSGLLPCTDTEAVADSSAGGMDISQLVSSKSQRPQKSVDDALSGEDELAKIRDAVNASSLKTGRERLRGKNSKLAIDSSSFDVTVKNKLHDSSSDGLPCADTEAVTDGITTTKRKDELVSSKHQRPPKSVDDAVSGEDELAKIRDAVNASSLNPNRRRLRGKNSTLAKCLIDSTSLDGTEKNNLPDALSHVLPCIDAETVTDGVTTTKLKNKLVSSKHQEPPKSVDDAVSGEDELAKIRDAVNASSLNPNKERLQGKSNTLNKCLIDSTSFDGTEKNNVPDALSDVLPCIDTETVTDGITTTKLKNKLVFSKHQEPPKSVDDAGSGEDELAKIKDAVTASSLNPNRERPQGKSSTLNTCLIDPTSFDGPKKNNLQDASSDVLPSLDIESVVDANTDEINASQLKDELVSLKYQGPLRSMDDALSGEDELAKIKDAVNASSLNPSKERLQGESSTLDKCLIGSRSFDGTEKNNSQDASSDGLCCLGTETGIDANIDGITASKLKDELVSLNYREKTLRSMDDALSSEDELAKIKDAVKASSLNPNGERPEGMSSTLNECLIDSTSFDGMEKNNLQDALPDVLSCIDTEVGTDANTDGIIASQLKDEVVSLKYQGPLRSMDDELSGEDELAKIKDAVNASSLNSNRERPEGKSSTLDKCLIDSTSFDGTENNNLQDASSDVLPCIDTETGTDGITISKLKDELVSSNYQETLRSMDDAVSGEDELAKIKDAVNASSMNPNSERLKGKSSTLNKCLIDSTSFDGTENTNSQDASSDVLPSLDIEAFVDANTDGITAPKLKDGQVSSKYQGPLRSMDDALSGEDELANIEDAVNASSLNPNKERPQGKSSTLDKCLIDATSFDGMEKNNVQDASSDVLPCIGTKTGADGTTASKSKDELAPSKYQGPLESLDDEFSGEDELSKIKDAVNSILMGQPTIEIKNCPSTLNTTHERKKIQHIEVCVDEPCSIVKELKSQELEFTPPIKSNTNLTESTTSSHELQNKSSSRVTKGKRSNSGTKDCSSPCAKSGKAAPKKRGRPKKVVENLDEGSGKYRKSVFITVGKLDSSVLDPCGGSLSANEAGNAVVLDDISGKQNIHCEDSISASSPAEKPAPKKRGRPRKTQTASVDMAACDGGNSTKKRRGRKKKCDEVQKEECVENPAAVDESSMPSSTSNLTYQDISSTVSEEIVLSETGKKKRGRKRKCDNLDQVGQQGRNPVPVDESSIQSSTSNVPCQDISSSVSEIVFSQTGKKKRGRKKKCDIRDQVGQELRNPASVDKSSMPSCTSNLPCQEISPAVAQKTVLLSETDEILSTGVIDKHPSDALEDRPSKIFSSLGPEDSKSVMNDIPTSLIHSSFASSQVTNRETELLVGDDADDVLHSGTLPEHGMNVVVVDECMTSFNPAGADIAAYVTLQTMDKKIGRKRVQISVEDNGPEKKRKAKYSDFTVVDPSEEPRTLLEEDSVVHQMSLSSKPTASSDQNSTAGDHGRTFFPTDSSGIQPSLSSKGAANLKNKNKIVKSNKPKSRTKKGKSSGPVLDDCALDGNLPKSQNVKISAIPTPQTITECQKQSSCEKRIGSLVSTEPTPQSTSGGVNPLPAIKKYGKPVHSSTGESSTTSNKKGICLNELIDGYFLNMYKSPSDELQSTDVCNRSLNNTVVPSTLYHSPDESAVLTSVSNPFMSPHYDCLSTNLSSFTTCSTLTNKTFKIPSIASPEGMSEFDYTADVVNPVPTFNPTLSVLPRFDLLGKTDQSSEKKDSDKSVFEVWDKSARGRVFQNHPN